MGAFEHAPLSGTELEGKDWGGVPRRRHSCPAAWFLPNRTLSATDQRLRRCTKGDYFDASERFFLDMVVLIGVRLCLIVYPACPVKTGCASGFFLATGTRSTALAAPPAKLEKYRGQ